MRKGEQVRDQCVLYWKNAAGWRGVSVPDSLTQRRGSSGPGKFPHYWHGTGHTNGYFSRDANANEYCRTYRYRPSRYAHPPILSILSELKTLINKALRE